MSNYEHTIISHNDIILQSVIWVLNAELP